MRFMGLCKRSHQNRILVSLFLIILKINQLFLSAIFMGMAWHQGTFIAHDAGHIGITHNYQIDNIFGMLIADWFWI